MREFIGLGVLVVMARLLGDMVIVDTPIAVIGGLVGVFVIDGAMSLFLTIPTDQVTSAVIGGYRRFSSRIRRSHCALART